MYVKMIIWGVICTVVLTVIGGAYFYYKSSQQAIADLNKQVASYTVALDQQTQALNYLESSIKEQAQVRNRLAEEVYAARRDVERMQSTIAKADLKHIASRKPTLLEKKINQGTVDILRCFELVTGDKVLPNEKNIQCSDLIDTSDGLS